MHAHSPLLRRTVPFAIVLLLVLHSTVVHGEWFATLKLPYNSPGYLAQWESDPQQILLTLNNHSTAPVPVVLEVSVRADATGEIFRGSCIPFMMVNNAPRAFRGSEVVRWNEIEWNPAIRGTLANARRVPEGDVQVCVRVYEWSGRRGAQLAEACEKTNVVYPDVPQVSSPRDDAHVSGSAVTLSWAAPTVPTEISLQYRVEISEAIAGARAEDVLAHPMATVYTATTSATFAWGKPLRRGADYCWRVMAIDQYGQPATAHGGFSRIARFHFDAPDDRETERVVARLMKAAASELGRVSADGIAAPLVAPVVSSLSGSPSAQVCSAGVATLRTVLDSLAATGSPVTLEAIGNAATLLAWADDAAENPGVGPFDSLAIACITRAGVARHVSTAAQAAVDSLIGGFTAMRPMPSSPATLAAAIAAHLRAAELAAQAAESPVWHDRMDAVLIQSAAVVGSVWPVGSGLADAIAHVTSAQRFAQKKSQDGAVAVRMQTADALRQYGQLVAAGEAAPNIIALYDAIRKALSAAEALRAQWKGTPDGLHLVDSARAALTEAVDALLHEHPSVPAQLLVALVRAQSQASKKGAGDFDKFIALCRDAIGQPKNVALQYQLVSDLRRAVVERGPKADKAWGTLPVDVLDRAATSLALGSAFATVGARLTSDAGSIADAGAKAAAIAFAQHCELFATRCAENDPLLSVLRDLGDPVVRRRLLGNAIRDVRAIARTAGGATAHTCAELEEHTLRPLLQPVFFQGTELAAVRGELEKRGLSMSFGKSSGGCTEVQGKSLVVDATLADQDPRAIAAFAIAMVNDAGGNPQSRYAAYLAAREVLKKTSGDGWNAAADFFSDAGRLGEQDAVRMFRSTTK